MRLTRIEISNYRSIVHTKATIEPLQALVGENNAGKSNFLRALECFLTPGAGGMKASDFNDAKKTCWIECEFSELHDDEKKRFRPYLLNNKIVLRKQFAIDIDEARARPTVKSTYHGYQAEPKDWYLSISKIEEKEGSRPKWSDIAQKHGILDYVQNEDGKVTKASYKSGVETFLHEHEVPYDEPILGNTQALGIPQNLLSGLPGFYLLPAITDFSDEIDRRSSTSVFRRLMGDLSDRLMQTDPRRGELEEALAKVRNLLNSSDSDISTPRLETLKGVEASLKDVICRLMPSVQAVSLGVNIEQSAEIFSKGVTIRVDDGVMTDVLEKGNGMQRSIIFALLQMLISSSRSTEQRPIILAIEEPELYIHPHSQRLIFRVLKEFAGVDASSGISGSDQIVYTTHSPAFVEVWNYERIGVVSKPDLRQGTMIKQAATGVLGSHDDKKTFKMLTSFGLKHNEVFFARDAILVEGVEDEIGVIATARKLKRIKELPDELGLSIVVALGKGEIPKFQRILNAFGLSYAVLLELDGKDESDKQTASIIAELNGNRIQKVPKRVEDFLGLNKHFEDQRHAKVFFSDPNNITQGFETLVAALLPPAIEV